MMKPLSVQEFQEYRQKTGGCLNVSMLDVTLEHEKATYSTRIQITPEHKAKVPSMYGSVVYAALDTVDWYAKLNVKRSAVDSEGMTLTEDGWQTAGKPAAIFQVYGVDEDAPGGPVIYVKGTLP